MSIAHYDPISSLRLFEDAFNRLLQEPRGTQPWTPAVDIFETANELVVKADLPDVDIKDVEVRVENNTLLVRGERKFEKQEDTKGFHRIERTYGSFVRSFQIPSTVETEGVAADYKNGVLTVKLPKKEAAKPKQVRVEIKG